MSLFVTEKHSNHLCSKEQSALNASCSECYWRHLSKGSICSGWPALLHCEGCLLKCHKSIKLSRLCL